MPTHTLVIAEPGATHEGRYEDIVRLIHAAHAAGADVFKPGWTSDPVRMCERRHIGPDHPKRAYYERAYGWLAFPREWHEDFARLTKQLGMQYATTSYLPEDVAVVDPFVTIHKISSFENGDPALLSAALGSRKRALISSGMMAENGIHRLCWEAIRTPILGEEHQLQALLCTSAYPTPINALHLGALVDYADGVSDHSRHLLTGAVAVGAGADIIETHVRLDDCDPENPDYAVAFSPREFAQYVANIRTAETMMGDGVKRVQPCEEAMLPYRVGTVSEAGSIR